MEGGRHTIGMVQQLEGVQPVQAQASLQRP